MVNLFCSSNGHGQVSNLWLEVDLFQRGVELAWVASTVIKWLIERHFDFYIVKDSNPDSQDNMFILKLYPPKLVVVPKRFWAVPCEVHV